MPPSPPIGPLTMEQNVDRPGQDYGYFPLQQANPDQCRIACQNDGRCSAYTYVHPGVQAQTAMCWLKASVPNPVQNACCISGKR